MTGCRPSLVLLALVLLVLGTSAAFAQSDSPLRRAPDEPAEEQAPVAKTPDEPGEEEAPVAETPDEPAEEQAPVAETPDEPAEEQPPVAETPDEPAEEQPTVEDSPDEFDTGEEAPSDPPQTGRPQSRARLELLGAGLVPGNMNSKEMSFGVGGFVAYDLWDRYGFELLLCQLWGSIPWEDGERIKSRRLVVKPGLRYRLLDWKEDTIRFYLSGHAGLVQANWRDPAKRHDSYREAFGFDGGLGVEFRFGGLVLLNLFGMYEAALNARPQPNGKYATTHGLFIGLALGISSTLN